MKRNWIHALAFLVVFADFTGAHAACPTFHNLTNGSTADAGQVMDNFNYILSCPGFTGNVGIGTSSPNALLDLAGSTTSSATAVSIRFTDTSGVPNGRNWIAGNSAGPGYGNFAFLVSSTSGGNPSGTPILTLASSGNVGVGASAPAALLDLTGNTTTSATAVSVRFTDISGLPNSRNWIAGNSAGPGYGNFSFLVSSASGGAPGGTPVLTLASSGNVGIDTASPSVPLTVYYPGGTSAGQEVASFESSRSGATDGTYIGLLDNTGGTHYTGVAIAAIGNNLILNGSAVGINTTTPGYSLYVNGSAAGPSGFQTASDVRLKKNIVLLSDGLALISKLRPVRFDFRSKTERNVGKDLNLPAGRQVGFIAQDLDRVLPEAVSVSKNKDAIMSISESKVVPVLVAAVNELRAANDRQAIEIAQLKDQLNALSRGLRIQAAQR